MKIRNGFVSNSSSSSFIIGIGVITDEAKFDTFCEEKGIKDYVDKMTAIEIKSRCDKWWNDIYVTKDGQLVCKEAFDGSSVSIPYNDDYLYAVVQHGSDFDDGDCDEDPNYDIDASYFDGERAEYLFEINEMSAGVSLYDVTCGAGRNG